MDSVEDFSLVFSPLLTEKLVNKGDALSLLTYGYLMRHQYCRLYVFSDEEVVSVINECFNDSSIIESDGENEFLVNAIDNMFDLKYFEWVVNTLCFKVESMELYNKTFLRVKIKTIFDEREIINNRRAITSHN